MIMTLTTKPVVSIKSILISKPMLTIKALVALLSASAALLPASPSLAADIQAGKAKSVTCAACHGQDGNTPIDPSYPRLAGQHTDYLLQALVDYKNDRRKNAIMGGQAKILSSTDMKNLAAYYGSLPGPLTHKR